MTRVHAVLLALSCALSVGACDGGGPSDSGNDAAGPVHYCDLPGDLPGVVVPAGYCVRRFAGGSDLGQPRTLAITTNGDVLVGSPGPGGAGGGPPGAGAVLVLSDDDHDGVAEVGTFLQNADSNDVHGIAVTPTTFYWVSSATVHSTPYAEGMRSVTGPITTLGTVSAPGRTTHGLAVSAGGTVYVSNAGGGGICPDPSNGGFIAQVQGGTLTNVAVGFRNPMYIRCHPEDEVCVATELGDDGGAAAGAREKLFAIRPSTDYGYPCCATTNMPEQSGASCSAITTEDVHFTLGDTPFGMDWERGVWTDSWAGVLCVAKHGSFYTSPAWAGVGIVCAPTDPSTHMPTGAFATFVDGFGSQNASELRRPSDVAFAPDGRMFFSDDFARAVYWVAPVTLHRPGL